MNEREAFLALRLAGTSASARMLLTTREVAWMLSVKPATVLRLIKGGELQAVRVPETSRAYYVRRDELDRFVASLETVEAGQ